MAEEQREKTRFGVKRRNVTPREQAGPERGRPGWKLDELFPKSDRKSVQFPQECPQERNAPPPLKTAWRAETRLAPTYHPPLRRQQKAAPPASSVGSGGRFSGRGRMGSLDNMLSQGLLVGGVCGGFCGFLILICLPLNHLLPEINLTSFQ